MKTIVSILNFFIFRRNVVYESLLTEEQLLIGIAKHSKTQRNTEGKIINHGFEMIFLSDFALFFPTKLPLIDISGKTFKKNSRIELSVKIRLNIIPKFIFPVGLGIIFLFYFLEKYTDNDFGGISNSIFPLFSIPFIYGFLILTYLIESESCKNYFKSMIKRIEKENGNEL